MKIIRKLIDRDNLESFAEKNNLVMEVHERSHIDSPTRFYAHFKNAEIKDGSMLIGAYGDGSCEALAIKDYAKRISGQWLVIDAYKPARKEIKVPILL